MGEPAINRGMTGRKHQRRVRNLLLEKGFQLKYAGYLVLIALLLSSALGMILWRTSRALVAQSQQAVKQGEQVVQSGREVLEESEKVNAVVQMSIVNDPEYGKDPALREVFSSDARERDQKLQARQLELRDQAQLLAAQSTALRDRLSTMSTVLVVALSLLVVLIGLVGIFVTHKVAGPVHKLKGRLRALGEGDLSPPGRLRKGDEFVEMFEEFDRTVASLRARQQAYLESVDSLLATSQGSAERQQLSELRELLYRPLASSQAPPRRD